MLRTAGGIAKRDRLAHLGFLQHHHARKLRYAASGAEAFQRPGLAVTDRAGRADAQMADLTSPVIHTGIQAAIEDQAGSEPRAERDEHQVLAAAPGAVTPFSQRARIGIIEQPGRQLQGTLTLSVIAT